MVCAGLLPVMLPIYLVASFIVVAYEESGHYVEAAAIAVVAVPVLVYGFDDLTPLQLDAIETLGSLWLTGKLLNKAASAFSSTSR